MWWFRGSVVPWLAGCRRCAIFITQGYPNLVEKATFLPKVFGTELFLFLFKFLGKLGYQKIAFSTKLGALGGEYSPPKTFAIHAFKANPSCCPCAPVLPHSQRENPY